MIAIRTPPAHLMYWSVKQRQQFNWLCAFSALTLCSRGVLPFLLIIHGASTTTCGSEMGVLACQRTRPRPRYVHYTDICACR